MPYAGSKGRPEDQLAGCDAGLGRLFYGSTGCACSRLKSREAEVAVTCTREPPPNQPARMEHVGGRGSVGGVCERHDRAGNSKRYERGGEHRLTAALPKAVTAVTDLRGEVATWRLRC